MKSADASAPVVVALIGIPGSGKSQLARAIGAKLGWPIVDRDSFPRAQFDAAGKRAATEATFSAIAAHLSTRQSCIVDGMTFSATAQRAQLLEIAQRHAARTMWLWLDCPLDVAVERVKAQTDHPARDRNEALVREVAARFERPGPDALRLDATRPPEELLLEILPRVSAR